MEATIVSDDVKHYPVLLKEIISVITPQRGGTFIDCTFGQGGYSKEILKHKNTKVLALDRDIESKKKAVQIEEKYPDRFHFKNLKFSKLNNLKLKNENIKGIIFDLGYSLTQIKDPKKGLSFNSLGELNMMMGLNEFSANDAINKLNKEDIKEENASIEREIKNDLSEFGVESDAPDLFNNDSESLNSNEFLSTDSDDEQEDDLEIPAFLRRQKN